MNLGNTATLFNEAAIQASQARGLVVEVIEMLANNTSKGIILEGLVAQGMDKVRAEDLVDRCERMRLQALTNHNAKLSSERRGDLLRTTGAIASHPVPMVNAEEFGPFPVPEPLPDANVNKIVIGSQEIQVTFSCTLPRVIVFDNLLSSFECMHLITQSEKTLARSTTVDNATGGTMQHPDRTSDGTFFQRGATSVIKQIEDRIAALLKWPLENGEGLQMLRYQDGQEYKPHHDYFDPRHAASHGTLVGTAGQRVASLVMYLSEPEEGGATIFPDAGFRVHPKKGSAVFFSYPSPVAASKTLHGGAPVIKGVKYVATKWLRVNRYG